MTSQRPQHGLAPPLAPSFTGVRPTQRFALQLALPLLGALLAGCPQPRSLDADGETAKPVARRGSFSDVEAATSARPERNLDPASLQNMSELLAGLIPTAEEAEAEEAAEGAASTLSPVWQEHGQIMDAIWQRIAPRHQAIASWSEASLARLPTPDAPLVYPFGGPDLVTAMSFFPDAESYILVGLEAPGRLPLPESFSGDALADDLRMLRSTFDSMVQSGYFVRSHLDQGVHDSEFDGVLPILLICLVRTGQLPLAVDYVGFDRDTLEIQPLPAEQTETSAVRILFRQYGDALGGVRAVYYFAQDLSNRGLLSDDPFSELLRRQDALNVYMKAAEYLLHTSDFLQFRKILLHEAQTILQDDSGIPIRHFTSDRWTLHLFGHYTDVLAAYKSFFQEDLAAAFARQAEELPFRIGYAASGDGGGLILAERKPETDATPARSQVSAIPGAMTAPPSDS